MLISHDKALSVFCQQKVLRNKEIQPILYAMGVNDRIRKEIKKALIDSGKSQKEIAGEMGVKPQYISEMLNTEKSGVPKRWEQLLEVVGLELFVRKKGDGDI